jgi:cytochrome c oxidase subunit III
VNRPISPATGSPARTTPLLPNPVMAMLIFVVVEVMMFAGFISAFVISKAQFNVWPPPGQPRLPVEATAVNTLVLLASGILLFVAGRKFAKDPKSARLWLLIPLVMGICFVGFQGIEWFRLLSAGLTMYSGSYGSFFYMIVGMHALHAWAAIKVLLYLYVLALRGKLTTNALWTGQIFWYFVVGIWPILYILVYL